jgi:hypothetical protein
MSPFLRCLLALSQSFSKLRKNSTNALGNWVAMLKRHNAFRMNVSLQLTLGSVGGNFVGFASFVKGGVNQENADRAQSHANKRGDAHYFRPSSSHFLRSQILFFAFIFALGLASLFYTIRRGKWGGADPFYTIFGVLAVYLGGLGCLIL